MSSVNPDPEITPGHPTGEERVVGDTFPRGATPSRRDPSEPDPQVVTEAEALSWMDDDEDDVPDVSDDATSVIPDAPK